MLHIKNMVCPRCVTAVASVLKKMGIGYSNMQLGQVILNDALTAKQENQLQIELNMLGFSLIGNRRSQLIERMKNLVVEKIFHSRQEFKVKWAAYVSSEIGLDYKYLSSLFSSVESITFEQYIINQKIERVKELLIYDELSLKEIAYQLDYSSIAYLSNQFKKVTGMTPTQFKKGAIQNRKSLDDI
ncbi:helix-turn-helix domain-containing protein [Allomuricauda sp. ARW1Y1]|uniref:helix-turn-helix domain-containing protein n=1 Tax=Allomuricauda sp. ARW1Y1 TaxID=2663843 RepID=UPI0017D1AF4E|nr:MULTISPECIES: AraC family transcriptional regulator [unclassified Allomuricauda]NYJ28183.1 AraC-like DNA-binding protein [Muricauda sp. ARW1Y1]